MATLISDELRWIADQIVHHCGYPSAVLSGLAPDWAHLDRGGFHCSVQDLNAHGNGSDYSNTRATDKDFNPLYGAAFDVSLNKTDMVKAHDRVRAVWADKTDPRHRFVNAINCWDGTGDATRYDFDAGTAKYASPDHQWHVHGEIHRRYVRDPKAARAIVSVFNGEPKAAWTVREEAPAAVNKGDDMPSVTDIWTTDGTVGTPSNASDVKTNPKRSAGEALTNIEYHVRATETAVAAQSRSLLAAVTALASKDQVDEKALAAELVPGVVAGVVAALPEGVEVDEKVLLSAIVGALRALAAPGQS